jgi:hypothetical protein
MVFSRARLFRMKKYSPLDLNKTLATTNQMNQAKHLKSPHNCFALPVSSILLSIFTIVTLSVVAVG